MSDTISIGRWRGLKTTSLDQHIFTILAFDQRGTYRKMLPDETPYEQAVTIKQDIVVTLAPQVSAVLLDNQYGFASAAHMTGRSGLLLSYEKSGYSGDATYRRMEFDPAWPIAKIKRMGASAIKFMVYYHPHSGQLAEEIEAVVAQVRDECHRYDLPLFLEPMSYSLDANIKKESAEFAKTRPEVVRDTATRLGRLKPDVLKLEFPVDAAFNTDQRYWQEACEAVSAASEVPWVLLSAGVDFDTFADQTRIACQSGASGFLAGRAIWKEAVLMGKEERSQFLQNVAIPRLKQLTELSVRYARPWTEFFQPIAAETKWHETYPDFET